MKPTRSLPLLGTLLALIATTLVLAGSGAVFPAEAEAQSGDCVATGPTLDEAKDAYAAACNAPRVDCDEIDGIWNCSSGVIGDNAPGGVTATDPTPVPATPEPTTSPTPAPTTPPTGGGNGSPTDPTDPTEPTDRVPTPGDPEPDGTSDPTEPTPAEDPEPTPVVFEPTPGPEPTPEPEPTRAEPISGVAVEHTYSATDGPNDNPLKGWNSGWSDDRPESTVGFQYIKWSELEPANGVFDFEAVEDIIDRSGSNGRHLILRLYCDWWGTSEESRGCPEWIYSEVGVDRIQGDNGRYITDYNDPRYVDQAIQAIEALAERYDDDPRLYTFELGVLGYWGEWHTYGSQVNGSPYEISAETETRIVDAYRTSFERVRLVARYPYRSIMEDTTDIGFHNDYFRPNNDHSAEFDRSVADGSRWLDGPIGGEIPPGLSSDDYDDLYASGQGAEMIDTGHYSTMKPGSVSDLYADAHMALHRRFGYNYQIQQATFSGSQPQGGQTNIVLAVENVGVAPMYYDWHVQFALIAADGNTVATTDAAAYDLRRANPGRGFNLAGAIQLDGVTRGEYRLGVRILQPGADQAKSSAWGLDARHTYILFANDLPVIDGQWSRSNELIGGWSILGSTSVG